MAIPNPDHYLDQAEHLIAWSGGRQVELRRAISAAYYGVFHAVMRAAADTYIGRSNHKSAEYAQAYRHIDHVGLKSVCEACKKQAVAGGGKATNAKFSADLGAFARAVVELQARRHAADYDPTFNVYVLDARMAVATAGDALNLFRDLPSDQKLKFLFMLMVRTKERS